MLKKFYFPFLFLFLLHPDVGFKTSQLKNERVKVAFAEKETALLQKLEAIGVQTYNLKIFLRVFKKEKRLRLGQKIGIQISLPKLQSTPSVQIPER